MQDTDLLRKDKSLIGRTFQPVRSGVVNASRAALILAGLSGLTLAASGAANAQAEHIADRNVTAVRHCVVNLSTKAQACFSTFRGALSYATAGTVTDAPENVRDAVRDADLMARLDRPSATAASVVIGINWDGTGWEGDSISYTAEHGCTASVNDVDWQEPNLGSVWNDRISSFVTRNSCDQKMFRDVKFIGPLTGWVDNTRNLGSGSNQTSSIRWS